MPSVPHPGMRRTEVYPMHAPRLAPPAMMLRPLAALISAALFAAAVPGLAADAPTSGSTPAHRLVFVPFEDPSSKDGYVTFANDELGKKISAAGYTLVPRPGLDQVDARLGARDLCASDRAEGILVAKHIDHDQQYHRGVAHSVFGAVLGFVPIVGGVVANGVNTVISDDRSINHATLGALLVDCSGKKIWDKTVQGENTHRGRNEAAGGSGAIDDGLTKLVASILETLAPAPAAHAPAVPTALPVPVRTP
jgi:hypothetical protein